LAIYDDRRERDAFQDAIMSNRVDPMYQLGVKGVNDKVEIVNEKEFYKKLQEKERT
jgi:hypothetical protein